MARLRATVIGAGLIAGKKHIPAFLKQRSKVELIALCDLNLPAAQHIAQSFGIPKVYSDLSEMLSHERPDLVDICTPPQTHAKLAVEAMRYGCHVLIEKPMALTAVDCDAIVEASRTSGTQVCVAHSDLFYYPFMQARVLVSQGAIGEVRGMRIFLSTPTDYMTSHEHHWAHKLPGGVIGETGPHIAYMSLAFIHPIREVSVQAMKLMDYPWSRFEDYRIDLIGDQGMSSVTLSYATDQWAAMVEIFGQRGMLMLDLESMDLIRYRRPTLHPVQVGLSSLSEAAQRLRNTLVNGVRYATRRFETTHDIIVARFVESITKGTTPPVTAEEGRETVQVVSMIAEKLDAIVGPK